jgi:hypothetical protein
VQLITQHQRLMRKKDPKHTESSEVLRSAPAKARGVPTFTVPMESDEEDQGVSEPMRVYTVLTCFPQPDTSPTPTPAAISSATKTPVKPPPSSVDKRKKMAQEPGPRIVARKRESEPRWPDAEEVRISSLTICRIWESPRYCTLRLWQQYVTETEGATSMG